MNNNPQNDSQSDVDLAMEAQGANDQMKSNRKLLEYSNDQLEKLLSKLEERLVDRV